ncbi:MAG: Smr/MutS family protein [Deltaproteobacteria bacterium]|nr:Smr/MutS family protein [Deltaproteobacteria bacterium]
MIDTLRRLAALLAGEGRDVREPAPDPDDDTLPDDDPVVLPIEDQIDLHPFAPRDIPSVVEEYVWQCHEQGLREVRIIHGRGKGVQRRIVQSALGKNPLVESCHDAPPERGGWGATVAVIRAKERGE